MEYNSFVIIAINPETGKTEQTAQWEVSDTNEKLYALAAPIAARMINEMGVGSTILHIELCNA